MLCTQGRCWVWLLLWLFSCGCGGKYDLNRVEGTVTLTDGTPGGPMLQMSFECDDPPLSAKAMTDASGHYGLGTLKKGDGAPAGHYRVGIVEGVVLDPRAEKPPHIHPKYARFETSGLEFTVEKGRNTFDIQLDPP
jgi:hypothetical protein